MNTRTSYHSIAKFCHWTIVTLVAIQFVTSWFMTGLRHATTFNIFNEVHFSALSLFLIPVGLILLFFHFYKPVAKPEMENEGMMKLAAVGMHYALYVALIIVPFSGWATASMRAVPVNVFGLFSLPVLNIAYPSFMFTLGRMHGDIANILGFLALGHIAAGLYHHIVLKDQVLNRMRPNRAL